MFKFPNLKIDPSLFLNSDVSYDDYDYVLNKLEDDESKLIFYYRIMLDNTRDVYYSLKLLEAIYYNSVLSDMSDFTQYQFIKFLLKNNNYKKKIYIFGYNKILIEHNLPYLVDRNLHALNVDGIYVDEILDSYRTDIYDLKIIDENVVFDKDAIFIMTTSDFCEFDKKLIGINKENVFKLHFNSLYGYGDFKYRIRVQYFGESFLRPVKNEVFVDCGAFLLDSTLDFIAWCFDDYKKVYALEPCREIYNEALKISKNLDIKNIEIINSGVWSSKTSVLFDDKEAGAGSISLTSGSKVDVVDIDSVVGDDKVTLIKMDIEGSESDAIVGATNTIKRCRPRLLICGYHLKNDCIKLVKEVLSINSDYKVYIRHYNFNAYETVIYFV